METKTCITCKYEKPTNQFYKRKYETRLAYVGECKSCKCERSKKRVRANVEHHRKLVGLRYKNFGRYARYGISKEIFDAMLKKQKDACALCGTRNPGGKGAWHIDHEGSTIRGRFNQCESDAVRGILCHRCNVSLGHYEKLILRVGEKSITRYLG